MKKNLITKKRFTSKRVTLTLSLVFIAIMLIITYFPIVYLAIFSFTGEKIMGKWSGFSLVLYYEMFTSAEIMGALANSLIIGVIASTFATVLGTLAAVGIFYMRKIAKTASNGITQITMVNADIVTGVAFMLFFIVVKFIPGGYGSLIVAHTMICIPYVIMSVTPRLMQLNQHVYEAGLDLGANHLKTMFKVVVPQLTGGMIAGFMLAFTISFDDFAISKWLVDDIQTIPTYLYTSLKHGKTNELRALSTMLVVVIMAILVSVNIIQAKRAKKIRLMKI